MTMAETGSESAQTAERGQHYIVGIDLGTTNSAIARISRSGSTLENQLIWQRVSADQLAELRTLPSFLYLPGPHELPPQALQLPWSNNCSYIVGDFARTQGSRVPGRVVTSAKSWLAHRRNDPNEAFLPRESLQNTPKVSAVEATKRYLIHLREAWDYANPQHPLALQNIVLTVPASFDEVARELTLTAAEQAGLSRINLLEEPQAAFYAWLWQHQNWRQELQGIEQILICDIGGGTTDFTAIKFANDSLERVAVGEHLMLGGDNLDLAIAHLAEPRLGGSLDILQWGVLRHECRRVKEVLLGEEPPEECTLTIPGSGSKLLGGALSATITRDEVNKLVLDGFFPLVGLDEPVQQQTRPGLREWGLPYASDPAIPRHLAAFLRTHQLEPDAVLFNGGACRPAAITQRLCEILQNWRGGRRVRLLNNSEGDLAVAQGAAAFGWLKLQGRQRIKGGTARSYYLGVAEGQALCVVRRNQEEGVTQEIQQPELRLRLGIPVTLPLYSSTERPEDDLGSLTATDCLRPAGSLETVISGNKNEHGELPVHLAAQVTEIGTLELWAISQKRRWSLQLPLRGKRQAPTAPELDLAKLEPLRQRLIATFLAKVPKDSHAKARPRTAMSALEESLGPRDSWSLALNRYLWEGFLQTLTRRRSSPEHEAAWFNGAGFCLRPGLGYPLDSWRSQQMANILSDWMQYNSEERVRKEWWVFWRRLAPGLSEDCQNELWHHMAPKLMPSRKHLKSRIKSLLPSEINEFLRLAVSLERLELSEKIALGNVLNQRSQPSAELCWQLARLGARRLVGSGSNRVLPPDTVIPWIERFLAVTSWNQPRAYGYSLAEMARYTGERDLDVPESLRKQVAQRLQRENLAEAALIVSEITAIEEENRAHLLGDTLPLGLHLTDH
ncbi:MAG: Hsp70 family protein [bacterium]|nr:Hsp70 family protein [bacterium]